jgi:hypothetical protein
LLVHTRLTQSVGTLQLLELPQGAQLLPPQSMLASP